MIAVLGYTWRIDAAYQLVDLPAADDEIARLGELAAVTHHPLAHWYHQRVLAARAALSGRFDAARSQSMEAGQIATRMGDPFAAAVSMCFATVLALMRGDPREIPADYPASFTPIAWIPVVDATYALCLYLNGEHDEALARYEHVRPLLREPITEVRGTVMLQLVTELVEAFDDSEAAAWAHARWLPWADTAGLPGDSVTFCFGSADRAVGRMAAVLGRLDEAADALRTAAEVNLRLDARPWLTHTRLDLANVLRRVGGRPRRGRRALDRCPGGHALDERPRMVHPVPGTAPPVLPQPGTARPPGAATAGRHPQRDDDRRMCGHRPAAGRDRRPRRSNHPRRRLGRRARRRSRRGRHRPQHPYAQGMSVAAQTALALQRILRLTSPHEPGFTRKAQRTIARRGDAAWLIATGEDLRYPTTRGASAGPATRLTHRWLDRVTSAAGTDPVVNAALVDVLALLAPPTTLFRPSLAWHTLRSSGVRT
jgi:hypothetical protein